MSLSSESAKYPCYLGVRHNFATKKEANVGASVDHFVVLELRVVPLDELADLGAGEKSRTRAHDNIPNPRIRKPWPLALETKR